MRAQPRGHRDQPNTDGLVNATADGGAAWWVQTLDTVLEQQRGDRFSHMPPQKKNNNETDPL